MKCHWHHYTDGTMVPRGLGPARRNDQATLAVGYLLTPQPILRAHHGSWGPAHATMPRTFFPASGALLELVFAVWLGGPSAWV
jgi:hypothetical protein